MSAAGWIGFDLDGTLAHYDGWKGIDHIGAPIPAMVDLVRTFRAAGHEIRILTARVCRQDAEGRADAEKLIRAWCLEHIGEELPVTNEKDFGMWALYDDRAIAVELNTGRILGGEIR